MSTEQLYRRVARILEEARSQVARTVDAAMVHAYWHVSREIVEVALNVTIEVERAITGLMATPMALDQRDRCSHARAACMHGGSWTTSSQAFLQTDI